MHACVGLLQSGCTAHIMLHKTLLLHKCRQHDGMQLMVAAGSPNRHMLFAAKGKVTTSGGQSELV